MQMMQKMKKPVIALAFVAAATQMTGCGTTQGLSRDLADLSSGIKQTFGTDGSRPMAWLESTIGAAAPSVSESDLRSGSAHCQQTMEQMKAAQDVGFRALSVNTTSRVATGQMGANTPVELDRVELNRLERSLKEVIGTPGPKCAVGWVSLSEVGIAADVLDGYAPNFTPREPRGGASAGGGTRGRAPASSAKTAASAEIPPAGAAVPAIANTRREALAQAREVCGANDQQLTAGNAKALRFTKYTYSPEAVHFTQGGKAITLNENQFASHVSQAAKEISAYTQSRKAAHRPACVTGVIKSFELRIADETAQKGYAAGRDMLAPR